MVKIVISDEIVKDKDKPDLRKIKLNIPYNVLTYFLKKSDVVNNYAEFNIQTSFLLWSKRFLTNVEIFKGDNNTAVAIFYPYDKQEDLAKKTKRNYLKEKKLCAEFIIRFADKLSKLKV